MLRNDNTYIQQNGDPHDIDTGAGAFVYGERHKLLAFKGGVRLYDDAKVTYIRNFVSETEGGPEPAFVYSSGSTFTEDDLAERVWLLTNSYQVTIEPCDHAGATYTLLTLAPQAGDVMHCTTCDLEEKVEPHDYDSTGKCTVCGYQSEMYTVSFAAGSGSGSMGSSAVVPGSTFTLPACGFTVPEGQAFKEWSVKIGSAGAVSRQPGDAITVTADTTVTAVWKAVPFFKGHALVLSDEIGIRFGIDLSALSAEEIADICMVFTVSGRETRVNTADAEILEDGRYQFTCFVNTLQMAEKVRAVFHYGANGAQRIEDRYSIEDYVTYLDTHSDEYTVTAAALAHGIADYGHYAQIFLSEANNTPAGKYADMGTFFAQSYDADALRNAVSGYALDLDKGSSKVSGAMTRLGLDSQTSISVRLTVEDDTPLTATAALNDRTFEAEKQSDGSYVIKITGIKASQLGDSITISGTAGDDFSVKVSALTYVNSILNSSTYGNDANAVNAVASLYYYYLRTMEFKNDPQNGQ